MGKVAANLKEKKFSLYGVFDGHQGQFAAEYVKERLPYEIVYVLFLFCFVLLFLFCFVLFVFFVCLFFCLFVFNFY
jgi:hypothetical protein